MNKPIPDRRDLPPRTWRRRNILTLLAGVPTLLINIKKSQAENFDYQGNPFRDRFQSFRQTFRVEADRAEAERIVTHYQGPNTSNQYNKP